MAAAPEARIVVNINDLFRLLLINRCDDGSCSPSSDLLLVHHFIIEELKKLYPPRLRKLVLKFYNVKDEDELIKEHGVFPLKVFDEMFDNNLWIKGRLEKYK